MVRRAQPECPAGYRKRRLWEGCSGQAAQAAGLGSPPPPPPWPPPVLRAQRELRPPPRLAPPRPGRVRASCVPTAVAPGEGRAGLRRGRVAPSSMPPPALGPSPFSSMSIACIFRRLRILIATLWPVRMCSATLT
jgi:hypothetical protein